MVPYIDMHCDTLMLFADPRSRKNLRSNDGAVDFTRLRQGGAMAQFFAVFLPQPDYFAREGLPLPTDEQYIERLRAGLEEQLRQHADLAAPARCAADIERNAADGKVSAVLTMEDGRAVDGRLDNLDRFYALGFRAVALLWNHENCLGYPNSCNAALMRKGLKDFGFAAVERMNRLGMLIDVSHLSAGGFFDVAWTSRVPFIASHSNAAALCGHPRNLTDEQLRVLGDKGGVAGVNVVPNFLRSNSMDARISDMVLHIRHIVQTGGLDCCAIGTDFDGTGGNLEIGSADQMPRLFEALRGEGFSEDAIEKIAWRNAMRVFREVVG